MSFGAMRWAVMDVTDVTVTERMVLTMLCAYGDPDGSNIFPSQKTIAARLEVDASTVKRAVRSLEAKGLVQRVQGAGRTTRGGTTNLYRVTWQPPGVIPTGGHGDPRSDVTPGHFTVKGGAQNPLSGGTSAPQPYPDPVLTKPAESFPQSGLSGSENARHAAGIRHGLKGAG